ncbi:hypothetical protein JCM10450v2_002549 [Rhodotorula kratochvilovae]
MTSPPRQLRSPPSSPDVSPTSRQPARRVQAHHAAAASTSSSAANAGTELRRTSTYEERMRQLRGAGSGGQQAERGGGSGEQGDRRASTSSDLSSPDPSSTHLAQRRNALTPSQTNLAAFASHHRRVTSTDLAAGRALEDRWAAEHARRDSTDVLEREPPPQRPRREDDPDERDARGNGEGSSTGRRRRGQGGDFFSLARRPSRDEQVGSGRRASVYGFLPVAL